MGAVQAQDLLCDDILPELQGAAVEERKHDVDGDVRCPCGWTARTRCFAGER